MGHGHHTTSKKRSKYRVFDFVLMNFLDALLFVTKFCRLRPTNPVGRSSRFGDHNLACLRITLNKVVATTVGSTGGGRLFVPILLDAVVDNVQSAARAVIIHVSISSASGER